MLRLLVLVSLLNVLTFIFSAAEIANSDTIAETMPVLLWAATDPSEDRQVAKIDAAKFYQFTQKYPEKLLEFYDSLNIVEATKFLQEHAEESGTQGVNWIFVFAKILEKKLTRQTEDKEHGLPSLVVWAARNTGPGTELASVQRETLISFLFSHKSNILNYQRSGNVNGLIKYLDSTKTISASKDVDWKTVINDLKDDRQLFMSTCGIFKLHLCDNTKQ